MTADRTPSLTGLARLIHKASCAATVGALVFRGIFEQRPRQPDETEERRFVYPGDIEALSFIINDLKARLDEMVDVLQDANVGREGTAEAHRQGVGTQRG